MKKKGFTLVELLAVLSILAVLMVMAVPSITQSTNQAREKAYEDQINSLISAAKKWGASNNDKLFSENSDALCAAVAELSTQYVYGEGNLQTGVLASAGDPYAYGVEYSCDVGDGEEKTFYVLENNTDTVSLIMNMNIDSSGKGTTSGNLVAWSSDGDNSNGPVTALEYLEKSTISWSKLDSSQISLPTYNQIYVAGGNQKANLPTWMYENLYVSWVPVAYWTSTAFSSDEAWLVRYTGMLSDSYAGNTTGYGVRPVITINKNKIIKEELSLSFTTLFDEGYINQKKVINPMTEQELVGCIKISYDLEYSQYRYEYTNDDAFCSR